MRGILKRKVLHSVRTVFIPILFIQVIQVFAGQLQAELVPYFNADIWIDSRYERIDIPHVKPILFKAALIHTADMKNLTLELRKRRWGIIDEKKMNHFISENRNKNNGKIVERRLEENQTHFYLFQVEQSENIVATLAWDNPQINDLDLRIIYNGKVFFPLSLTEKGELTNTRDNTVLPIEKIELPNSGFSEFTLQITGKNSTISSLPYCLCVSGASFSKRQQAKETFAQELRMQRDKRNARVQSYIKENKVPLREFLPDGRLRQIFDIVNGQPQYINAFNVESAQTISTEKVWPGGGSSLSLTGKNLTMPMGIWDGGIVYAEHKEFGDRVIKGEQGELFKHADHVAGTMVAAGVNPQAKGMAYEAKLKSYDWNDDDVEMNHEASNGMLISNHSYGLNPHVYTNRWDAIVYNNPYYCIANAIGNAMMAPYHSIATYGNSKNLVAVGAVDEMPDGWQGPDVPVYMLSCKGPAPDGRIKPDIMACGENVLSTTHEAEEYYSNGGTSMASPSVAASMGLLQEHFYQTHGQTYMKAATVKGLVIHTANEIGDPGPDYVSGWGLFCTEKAAQLISDDDGGTQDLIQELTLPNGDTWTTAGTTTGGKVTVTLCWTDPPPDDTTGVALVNDLDLRVSVDGQEYQPWILDPEDPEKSAFRGDNVLDNVEKIEIDNLQKGSATVTVSHKGTLSSSQDFSLMLSGIAVNTTSFISLTSPDGGEDWEIGKEYTISWSDNIDHKVKIELLKEDAVVHTIADDIVNNGTYSWLIPESVTSGDKYKIKITSMENASLSDKSSNFFTIIKETGIIQQSQKETQACLPLCAIPNPAGKTDKKIEFYAVAAQNSFIKLSVIDPLGNTVYTTTEFLPLTSVKIKHNKIALWRIPDNLSAGAYLAVLQAADESGKNIQHTTLIGVQR